MVQVAEIGWGSYGAYEGPWWSGKGTPVVVDVNAEISEKTVMVTAMAEGGSYSAFNGYDSCGWTSGAIQWCENHQFSVSDMLGKVADGKYAELDPVVAYADSVGVDFEQDPNGHWRFKFRDSRGFVDNNLKQQQLFYRTGNGNKGTWTNDNKLYAKGWAAAISTVWEDDAMQSIQRVYTYSRLGQFFTNGAKTFFAARPATEASDAMYASYTSFAVNNPSWASSSLAKAVAAAGSLTAWSPEYLIHLLKHLTFDPGVAIYPARYNAIRPALETLYSVQLPDFAQELQAWTAATGLPAQFTTKQLQGALIELGYDLGSSGADGQYGPATKAALFKFEQENGVPPANQDGMIDTYTYPALVRVLGQHGLSFPAA
jgi:hypothetical protein